MTRCLTLLTLLLLAACTSVPTEPTATRTTVPTRTPTPVPTTEVTATPEPYYPPDFSVGSLDGTTYTLSELQGQWVIVNFWATWCIPCVTEMPVLEQIANDHADRLLLLGVNMLEGEAEVRQFVDEIGVTFPILINPPDPMLIQYSVVGLPQTLVIAPDGELVWRSFGPVELDTFGAELEGLFAQYGA